MKRQHLGSWLASGFGLALVALALWPALPVRSDTTPQVKLTAEQLEFFETKVRPVFAEACTGCHGKEAQQGNLRLDQAITPAQAKAVIERVRGEGGKPRMPAGAPALAPEKIAALEAWHKQGALWPAPSQSTGGRLWSLAPVRKPALPTVKLKAWPRNPIDTLVLAKIEAAGLRPAPYADRRTLIRRASYELTGLPPTADEVEAFVADKAPDAWPKVVDRLLASPRYGERMARFWMDIARYADTKGYVFTDDRNYYHAYNYRAWLINAFNSDMPYDRFVQYQLAADRMVQGDDTSNLAALGFLTLGRRFINNLHDIIDDRIDVTMRGLQGLTVGCARCHDHKFDPVPQKDYYGLYAVFASSEENQPIISPKEIAEPYRQHDAKFQAAKGEFEAIIRSEVKGLRDRVKQQQEKVATVTMPLPDVVKNVLQSIREEEFPPNEKLAQLEPFFESGKQARLKELRSTMETLKKSYPPTPEFAHGMAEGQPRPGRIFRRGNPGNLGDPAPRRYLSCVAGDEQKEWPDGGRLELAQAITAPTNPLTSRVIANRIWLLHFGNGIVRTPSDFGNKGEKPTHPELLDYLAASLVDDNQWSLKKLHRQILLSATWMQSPENTEAAFNKDPENRLVAHQNRRRLELEPLRDSLLWVSGSLDLSKLGGKSEELWAGNYSKRRAVYGFIERQNLPGIFKTLDFATPDTTSPQRFKTIVPQQALFLLNSNLVTDQARALVKLPEIASKSDDAGKIKALYRRLFYRQPTAEELNLGLNFVVAPEKKEPALAKTAPIWQYGWGLVDSDLGRVSAFHPFTKFGDGMWRAGDRVPDPAIGWAMLTAQGGHPGNREHMVIRRWTSPIEGKVAVDGKLIHPGKVGDGVRARVVHSRLGVLGDWTAQSGEAPTPVAEFEVKKGDTIDFVVDCRTDENTDSFAWAPVVRQAGVRGVWRAEKDFAGPEPGLVPLGRWERYAQALLMTNEFLYID